MKNNLKFLLLGLVLMPLLVLGQTETATELPSPSGLILALTPFIILGVTALVKLLKKSINGTTTLIIVTVLSAGVPYITDFLLNIDGNWLVQFGLGLASVFIHQFYTQFKSQE